MKKVLVLLVLALAYIGCDQSNPTAVNDTGDQAEFSEVSMMKTAGAGEYAGLKYSQLVADGPMHDSLRHGRMLDSMRIYLGLSDAQVESVKVYGGVLFSELRNIHGMVHAQQITRDSAKTLVTAARAKFVGSVRAILTAEQLVKFDAWIVKFWNRHRHGGRHGHHGPGGH